MSKFFNVIGNGAINGAKYGTLAAGGIAALGVFTIITALSAASNAHPKATDSYLLGGMFYGGGAIVISPFVLAAGIAVGAVVASAIACCGQERPDKEAVNLAI